MMNSKIYTLSLHDALPILRQDVDAARHAALLHVHDRVGALSPETRGDRVHPWRLRHERSRGIDLGDRSEEHTSELQSHSDIVCRLLLEKKIDTLFILYTYL